MTLINKLQQDQLTARKAKDKFTTTVLSTLYSECNRVGFDDGKRETTDGEVLKVIQKFVKNVDETMSLVEGTDKHTELSKEKDIKCEQAKEYYFWQRYSPLHCYR